MTHALHTLIAALLPPTGTVRLTEVIVEQPAVRLQLTAPTPTATCPHCTMPSSAIHSRYQRHPADLPWGTCAVHIQLMVRKFVCRKRACARRIFTERLPDLIATYARKTHRLITVLRTIGVALGGNAGARLAARLQLPTSPATVLRLVRAAPAPYPPALQAAAVGTALALTPSPRVASVPPMYQGRPRHTQPAPQEDTAGPPRHARWVAIDEAMRTLRARGAPIATMARQLGISRPTVYAYLRRDTPPGPRRLQRPPSARVLTPYLPYLIHRWRESGADSRQLWREIQALGYTHSARTVGRFITRLRRAAEAGHPPESQRSPHIDRRVPLLSWWLMAVGLVSLVNLFYSAWHQDWTYDEHAHLAWSSRLLETRETERTSHDNYASTTPVTLLNAVPFRFAQARHWGEPLPKFLARLPTIGWWLGLVVATFFFARHYVGEAAASLAAILVALDPNLAAHGGLVTVDVAYACMTLLCLWAFLKLYESPGYSRAAVAGIALGFALCTKYTALLLVPLCLIASAAGAWKLSSGLRAMLRGVGLTALIGASASLCICTGYLFSDIGVPLGAITPDSSRMHQALAVAPYLWLPLPQAFLSGFDLVRSLDRTTTWNVVLLGHYYPNGIWYYFFMVWLVKTPLALLAAGLVGIGSGLARGTLFRAFWSIFLLGSLVGFLAFFSFYFRTQVGLRYVLMCVPLGYLLAAPELGRWAQSTGRGATLVGAVVALALLETGGYFGNQLSFTNLVILPKKSAYRWIADSNVDWGQNDSRNWKILEAHQVTDRFEPRHILPGVNVFTLNTIAGIGWNHEQHRWVREHLEPKRHLNHTYLWYEVDETTFDRFLNEERHNTPPDDPGRCRAARSMRALAPEGSFRLSEGGGQMALVVGCLEVRERLDLEIIAERGELTVGTSPTSSRCDGEYIEEEKRAWFRLEPGLYPLCATTTRPFQGAWRIHHGSAGFSPFEDPLLGSEGEGL